LASTCQRKFWCLDAASRTDQARLRLAASDGGDQRRRGEPPSERGVIVGNHLTPGRPELPPSWDGPSPSREGERTMRSRPFLAILAGLIALQILAPTQAASVTLTRIGDPIWAPVDFHLFSARFEEDFSAFGAIIAGLLPPPRHLPHPDLGIGPGAAHAPP